MIFGKSASVTSSPPTFDVDKNETLSEIVNGLAGAVGLPYSTDVVGSADPKTIQLIYAINMAATDLIGMRQWTQLNREYTMTVIAQYPGQPEVAVPLPPDFDQFVSQTLNNATKKLPGMITSPQEWQALKTLWPSTTLTTTMWRIRDGNILFLYPPSTPEVFTFEYQSLAWCQDADIASQYKNRASKNGDRILIDCYLVSLLAKTKWLEMNRFDSSSALRDFSRQYDLRVGNQTSAPLLNMARNINTFGVADTATGGSSGGIPGPQGPMGPQGPKGDNSLIAGPRGPKGEPGEAGVDGSGFTVKGTLDSADLLPTDAVIGDAYIIAGNLYIFTDTGWVDAGPIKGDTGDKGETGAQGPQGIQGARGLTGENGADSTVPGPAGPQGSTGVAGPKGDTGAPGRDGVDGQDGTGFTVKGTAPDVGSLPTDAAVGDGYMVGSNLYVWSGTAWVDLGDITGPQGEQGIQGVKGDTGATGPQGEIGLTGAASTVPGPKGDTGDIGPAGPKGDTGAASTVAGPKGDTGPIGLTGPQGSAGTPGAASTVPGPVGPQGPQGPQGNPGADSQIPGPQGPQGPAGVVDTSSVVDLYSVQSISGAKTFTSPVQAGSFVNLSQSSGIMEDGSLRYGNGNSTMFYSADNQGCWNLAIDAQFNYKFAGPGTAFKTGGGTFTDLSDGRLKADVKSFTSSLDLINRLRPVSFSWKSAIKAASGAPTIGFLAEEVEQVFPSAVVEYEPTENTDASKAYLAKTSDQEIIDIVGAGVKVKSIGWKSDFFAYLVGAIKELSDKNNATEAKCADLEARLKVLEGGV